jgi:hypothetical protein
MNDFKFSSTNEEDLQILLDAAQEEYFINSVVKYAYKLGEIGITDPDKLATIIAEEFIKIKTAADAPQEAQTIETGEDYYNFSLSGYNLDTWMDYWFGLSEPGQTLNYNGVFFDFSNKNIELLNNRLKTLSDTFGYNLVQKKDISKEVTLKETSEETKSSPLMSVNVPQYTLDERDLEQKQNSKITMITDFQLLKKNPTKENFLKFTQKYPKLFVSTAEGKYVGLDRPGIKKFLKDSLYNLKRKTTEYLETGGTSSAKGLDIIGAGSGEKGTQATLESGGAKHQLERYKEWSDKAHKEQPEYFASLDKINNQIMAEFNDLNEQFKQKESVGEDTSNIRNEMNKKYLESKDLIQKKIERSYYIQDLDWKTEQIEKLIINYEDIIKKSDELLKLLSPGADLTIQDYDLLTNVTTELGEFGHSFLIRLGLYASKDVYFPELSSEQHAGSMVDILSGIVNKDVSNISDEMFNYTKDDLFNVLDKNIAENDANKIASKAILEMIIAKINDIITRYQVIQTHVENQKNRYKAILEDFNSPKTGIFSSIYGQLNKIIAQNEKQLKLKDVEYLRSTQKRITGFLNAMKIAEENYGSLFKNKEILTIIEKNKNEFGKKTDILEPYKHIRQNTSRLMDTLLDTKPEKVSKYSDILEDISYTKNMLDSFNKHIKQILKLSEKSSLSDNSLNLLKQYNAALGSIRNLMSDGLIKAYGNNYESYSEQLQGAELLKSALETIKREAPEGRSDINTYKSIISLFNEIPRFKSIINTTFFEETINKSAKSLKDTVLTIEHSIVPLKNHLNKAVNEDSLSALISQQQEILNKDLTEDIGIENDSSRELVATRINNEFNPQKTMVVDVIGDMTNVLFHDYEFSGSAASQKKDYHMRTRKRDNFNQDVGWSQSKWNFYNIVKEWNNTVISCLKSLASARKNETRTFNPKDSFGFRPNFVNLSEDEKSSINQKNSLYSYMSRTSTDSLATIMSETSRNKQITNLRYDIASDFNTFIDILNKFKENNIVKSDPQRIRIIDSALSKLNKLTIGYKNYYNDKNNETRFKFEEELKNLEVQFEDNISLLNSIREQIDSTQDIGEKSKLTQQLRDQIHNHDALNTKIGNIKKSIKEFYRVNEEVDLIDEKERNHTIEFVLAAIQTAESFPGEYEYYKKIAVDMDDKFKQFDVIRKAQEEQVDKELLFKMLYARDKLTAIDRESLDHITEMASLYKTNYSRDFGKNINPGKYKEFVGHKQTAFDYGTQGTPTEKPDWVKQVQEDSKLKLKRPITRPPVNSESLDELIKLANLLEMTTELRKQAQETERLSQLDIIDNLLNNR